jgi:beta-phosphoglucomutase
MADSKNEYLTYLVDMDQSELLPGVLSMLQYLKEKPTDCFGISQQNAYSGENGIRHYFDAIVDGNDVSNAKPDPEVFLIAAKLLDVNPENCF